MRNALDAIDKPIDWHDPLMWPLLGDLQGNVLKGHGRDYSRNIFLRFDPARGSDVRQAIRAIAAQITSALAQLRDTAAFKGEGRAGGTVLLFAMAASGYRAIGLSPPGNSVYSEGMATRTGHLNDPDVAGWEPHLVNPDAVIIIADDLRAQLAAAAAEITAGFEAAGITVLGHDSGQVLRRPNDTGKGEGIEHFGYVDGRSQPLLLAEDVAAEAAREGGFVWDPGFSPARIALVRDPHGAFEESFGSYLVYRKLAQDVVGFRAREVTLANALGLVGPDRDRAGAMAVGRFRDGTPLTTVPSDGIGARNNFSYAHDADGMRCPFHAHIRKCNPRGDTIRRLGGTESGERSHLMVRRGIAYGDQSDLAAPPDGEVGLLFMAYNADIARQFEFTQANWMNEPAFVDNALTGQPLTGQDAVAGNSMATNLQRWRASYGSPATRPICFGFGSFVQMRGGEYFFQPSLSALAAL